MTNEQVNRTITEVMGLKWHDPTKFTMERRNPSYTSNWLDYGKALEWAQKQDWWEELAYQTEYVGMVTEDLLNPLRGSHNLAEFIVANPELMEVVR